MVNKILALLRPQQMVVAHKWEGALEDMRQRNKARVEQKIAELGTKYLCHPSKRVGKLDRSRNEFV